MFKRAKCCENGINPKAVYEFIKDCERLKLGIDSFMLLKNGTVVSEGYHKPYSAESPHVMYSMSKSITATALGYAISEGKVNLDDSISKYFPEYDKNGKNKAVTVKHLVTMTAGKMIGMAKNRHHKDWIKIFFDAPFIAKPGKLYLYTNDNFYILSALLSRVYGETLVDFLYPRLFKPLDIKKPVWEVDDFGYAAGGWGLYMSIEDQAKIMYCYSQYGVYNGKQVLPRDWIEQATAYQVPTVKKGQIDVRKGYGYGFWRTAIPDTYRAYGLHGQLGYVFSHRDTVLVINSGISKDALISAEVVKLYKHLWDKGNEEYEEKLREYTANLGDKDNLPVRERNYELEKEINHKPLRTHSSVFASVLPATMTAVMNDEMGHLDNFTFDIDKNGDVYLFWKESKFINRIKLGMNNEYECTPIFLGGIHYHAYAKASWTSKKVLTVLIRLQEGCHVRRLIFDFNQKKPVIMNNSFPDMPTLAAHYVDFSGIELPKVFENALIKYIAPGVLLYGEPNFKIRKLHLQKH